jgi:hypothetical protein
MNEEIRRNLELYRMAFTQKKYLGLCSRNVLDGFQLQQETVDGVETLIAYEENENNRQASRYYAYCVAVLRYEENNISYYDLIQITRHDASLEDLTKSATDIAKKFIE